MKKCGVWFGALILVVFGGGMLSYRWHYPYGDTHHACLSNRAIALRNYAELYGGFYPAGGSCPEASLSLLSAYGDRIDAGNLGGKTVRPEFAQQVLNARGELGPESCAWHYVEGLTVNDDPQLALLWDTIGLGHFRGRLAPGGHEVLFVNGNREIITGEEWPEFTKEQERLHAKRKARRR